MLQKSNRKVNDVSDTTTGQKIMTKQNGRENKIYKGHEKLGVNIYEIVYFKRVKNDKKF